MPICNSSVYTFDTQGTDIRRSGFSATCGIAVRRLERKRRSGRTPCRRSACPFAPPARSCSLPTLIPPDGRSAERPVFPYTGGLQFSLSLSHAATFPLKISLLNVTDTPRVCHTSVTLRRVRFCRESIRSRRVTVCVTDRNDRSVTPFPVDYQRKNSGV